jgi:hypothetical protein
MKRKLGTLKSADSTASIIVGVVGLALSVVPLIQRGADAVQWVLMGVAVLFLGTFLYTIRRYSALEQNVLAIVQGDGLLVIEDAQQVMDELYATYSTATGYVDSRWFERFAVYCAKSHVTLKTKWLFMAGKLPSSQPSAAEIHLFECPLNALFFFESHTNSPGAALLFTASDVQAAEPICIRISDPRLSAAIYSSFTLTFDAHGVKLGDAVDPVWLLQHIDRTRQRIANDWSDLKDLKIAARSPSEISTEQLALSRQATTIHAFDLTQIDEWFDPANLGGCLSANIKSARNGPDGMQRIRRVFFAPTRDTLTKHLDYARKLKAVLEMHKTGGLGYGLVFQQELKMRQPTYVKDFAVYSKRVVWVETQDTGYGGEGYFSTAKSEVDKYIGIFEAVWAEDTPKSPAEDAEALLTTTL